eukprot:m.12320 g.12320  ORF g.12320 m.12320 type:complete len:527 (+) comp5993_c0_seq1:36-1616(+)
MASAPKEQSLPACPASKPPAPQETQEESEDQCAHCCERAGTLYCRNCAIVFCIECDAAVHVRGLRGHARVPASERPFMCPVHNDEEAKGFCFQDERLVCASCLMVGTGECAPHAEATKPLSDAAAAFCESFISLERELKVKEEEMEGELTALRALQAKINERVTNLNISLSLAREAQSKLAKAKAQSVKKIIQEAKSEKLAATEARDSVAAVFAEHTHLSSALSDLHKKYEQQQQPPPQPSSAIAAPAPAAAADNVAAPPKEVPAKEIKVPSLTALPAPRVLPEPPLMWPTEVTLSHDGSLFVGDWWVGGHAWQLFLDGSHAPLALTLDKAITCVLALEDGDLLALSGTKNTCKRIGKIAWLQQNLGRPWAMVLRGDTLYVTEAHAGQVVCINAETGSVFGNFGKKTLREPRGIALGPVGDIVVADSETKSIHIFDPQGIAQRVIGERLFVGPWGVCVDAMWRVYVADFHARKIYVLDGTTGALLSTIVIGATSQPRGVAVTPRGELVVSFEDGAFPPKGGLAVIG